MAPSPIGFRSIRKLLFLCLFLALPCAVAGDLYGQTPDEAGLLLQARSLWASKQWEGSVTAYERYLKEHLEGSHRVEAFLVLGEYLEAHNRFEDAMGVYVRGLEKAQGKSRQLLQIRMAGIHTRMREFAQAIELLQEIMCKPQSWELFKAANNGLKSLCFFKVDEDKFGRERGNCGEECLKVVLDQFGIVPRDEVLARLPGEDGKLSSLTSLRQAALAHGLESFGARIERPVLTTITPPGILHFIPNHFVVFRGLTEEGVKIMDTASGAGEERLIAWSRFQELWSGTGLFFQPQGQNAGPFALLDSREMERILGGYHSPEDSPRVMSNGAAPNTDLIDPPRILVNSSSLNLIMEEIDGSWNGMGPDVILKRTYNSDDTKSGMFGHSWHFQYEIFFEEDVSHNVTVTRGDGRADKFMNKGDGTYAPPKGVFDQLTKNPDGTYTLLRKGTKSTVHADASGYLARIADKNGNVLEFTRGANGLTEITIHYGTATSEKITFKYGANGKCLKVTLPDKRFAAFTYDSQGNLRTATDPAGYQTSYTYDANSYLNSVTNDYGTTVIAYQNDPANNKLFIPRKITDPLDNNSTFELVVPVITYTDSNGNPTRYTSDTTTGFTTSIVDAQGGTTAFEYDSYGNRKSITDPAGQKWLLSYDPDPSCGNLGKVTNPMGQALTMTYNAVDDLIAIDAPLGRHVTLEYDASHNLAKATNALSGKVTVSYDPAGHPKALCLPGNPAPAWKFAYDDRGNLRSEVDPRGSKTSYTYDRAGRVVTRTDAKGTLVKFGYDKLNRLTEVTYPDGVVTYTYDCCALKQVKAKDQRLMTFQYDADVRLTRHKDLNGFVLRYGYDGLGNLTSLTYPGGESVAYTYDPLNRLKTVTDWLQRKTIYTYDEVGNVVEASHPNGTSAKSFYNKSHRLMVHQNMGVADQLLPQFAYLLDELGNRAGETRRYAEFSEPSVNKVTSVYDLADRILNLNNGSTVYQHDKNGNMIQQKRGANTVIYSYDNNNMLTSVETPSQTYQYEYDPLLNRISKKVGKTSTLYAVDPNVRLPRVLMQAKANKKPTDYFVYGLGLISRISAAGEAFTYHYDGLGNTVAVTDASGHPVNRYEYDPFGRLLNKQESFKNPYRYVGRHGVMDEGNGLLYMRARYYSPEIGRFVGKDPIGFLGGMNRYVYVQNNPMTFIDPSGLLLQQGAASVGRFFVGLWHLILNVLDTFSQISIPPILDFFYGALGTAASVESEQPGTLHESLEGWQNILRRGGFSPALDEDWIRKQQGY